MKDYKNLKELKIGLENCDDIIIPSEYIKFLGVDGITESRFIYTNSGEVHKDQRASNVMINILPEANIDYYEFGQEVDESFKTKIFKRLNIRDITDVTLSYSDGYTERYIVPWGDDEEDNEYADDINSCQMNTVLNNGGLLITINRENYVPRDVRAYNENGEKIMNIESDNKKESILGYIQHLQSSGLGKQKSLDYLYKYIDKILDKGDSANE